MLKLAVGEVAGQSRDFRDKLLQSVHSVHSGFFNTSESFGVMLKIFLRFEEKVGLSDCVAGQRRRSVALDGG